MKKIYLYLTDKNYEKRLLEALISRNIAFEFQIIEQEDAKKLREDDFLISDKQSLTNSLVFLSDKKGQGGLYKYQNINNILKEIERRLSLVIGPENRKTISLVNLNMANASSELNHDIANVLNQEGACLRVAFSDFYIRNEITEEKTLDDLVIADRIGGKFSGPDLVNNSATYSYINGFLDPMSFSSLKAEKIKSILELIKQSHYERIIYEYNFNFDEGTFAIMDRSDYLVFFKTLMYAGDYYTKLEDYIKKAWGNKSKILFIELDWAFTSQDKILTFCLKDNNEVIKKVMNFIGKED